MSVLRAKRKASQFEVFHHLYKTRRMITDLILRDFGYSPEKAAARVSEKLPADEREKQLEKLKAFDEWFIADERAVITNYLRSLTSEVFAANAIYPAVPSPSASSLARSAFQAEVTERRLHQDRALGHCHGLLQELQYIIETLPVDINKYTPFAEIINTEIVLIKGWRKSDNARYRAAPAEPRTSPT